MCIIKVIMEQLKEKSNLLPHDHYNEYTTTWSSGYKKGYEEAIRDFEEFHTKMKCNMVKKE